MSMTRPPTEGRPTWIWDAAVPSDDPPSGNGAHAEHAAPADDAAPFEDEQPALAEPSTGTYQLPTYLRSAPDDEITRPDTALFRTAPSDPALSDVAPSHSASPDPAPPYPAPEYPAPEYPAPEYAVHEFAMPEYPAVEPAEPEWNPAPQWNPAEWDPPVWTQSVPQPDPGSAQPDTQSAWPSAQPPTAPAAPSAPPRPEDLLLPERPATTAEPATWGWRGRVNRISGGLVKIGPTTDEIVDRQARLDIRRSFSRPMTIVVISPKGGAGKTPTTIGLASALGAHRGGYVVGWDDNETRGTLAVRVANAQAQHTTVWDLLGALPMFERTDARVGDLGHYVRGQGDAQFDALVSDDNPANMAQIGDEEFHRIHAVLERFYRHIIVDTGNNVRSLNWQAAVNAADLVVIVSTYQRDVGYSGSWVLDHLTETGREQLATRAITVLTAADPKPDPTVRGELLEHFGARTQAVVEIPFDPLVALGGPMQWRLLSEPSRRAWTRAGAAVVNALAAADEEDRRSRH